MKIACQACDYIGEAADLAKGSRKKEVLLWCCLIIPGIFYTLWRQSSDGRYSGCPKCESSNYRPLKRREWKEYLKTGRLPK